jgi:soluble lytic murein transglycosylase-like protein
MSWTLALVTLCWQRRGRLALVAGGLLWGAGPAVAQIYSNTEDAQATAIVLSNFSSTLTPHLLLDSELSGGVAASEPPVPPDAAAVSKRPVAARTASPELSALIDTVARDVRVSSALLHAVIAQESNFNPNAVSPKGALGLMQLLPQTASRFGARQAFDPHDNIRAGALYLRWLADRFDNRLDLILAAYNAGEQTVVRAGWQVPRYPETQNYVRRILAGLRCNGPADCSAVSARNRS